MHKKHLLPALHFIMISVTACVFCSISAAAAPPSALTISPATVVGSEESSAKTVDTILECYLDAGLPHTITRARVCAWNEIPPGCSAGSHVNTVRLRFGDRYELLALMPDPKSGELAMAARATALFRIKDMPHAWGASPGDHQYLENAHLDLLINFADALENASATAGVYQLVINQWEMPTRSGSVDFTRTDTTASTKTENISKVYPLAAAAMFAEGFCPTDQPRPGTITLSLRMGELDCSIRATLTSAGKTIHELERHHILYNRFYDSLRLVVLNLIEWQDAVADFVHPGPDNFMPLATAQVETQATAIESKKTILVGADNDGLLALDYVSGAQIWTARWGKAGMAAGRNGICFRYNTTFLSRLSKATGKDEYEVSIPGLPDLEGLDALENRTVHWSANKPMLCMENDQIVWTNWPARPLSAGPILIKGGIVSGDAWGNLQCLGVAEGNTLWNTSLPAGIQGRIKTDSDLLFVESGQGSISVVTAQGKLLWTAELGDVMAGTPQVIGNNIFVGSKSRKLFVFDKATGRCLKTRDFAQWLLNFRVHGKHILCINGDKRVRLLDSATLDVLQVLRFPFLLNEELIAVDDFPLGRASSAGDLIEKTDGILISDIKGNVFFCPADRGR